jgi:hypothetical protein
MYFLQLFEWQSMACRRFKPSHLDLSSCRYRHPDDRISLSSADPSREPNPTCLKYVVSESLRLRDNYFTLTPSKEVSVHLK